MLTDQRQTNRLSVCDFAKRHLGVCENLWNEPQINWDGRLLGCPCNCDFFAVNVFESGLDKALAHESYEYAKNAEAGGASRGHAARIPFAVAVTDALHARYPERPSSA